MLNKILIASLVLLMIVSLLPTRASADVSCSDCTIGDCLCLISDCDSGIFDIFSTSSCSLTPDFEYTFSNGLLNWSPDVAKSYYAKALCDDGETQSDCTLITVRTIEETTTTRLTTVATTTRPKTTTTIGEETSGGPNYLLYGLVVILVILILFALYYVLFKKKKPGKSYEELYRKWGK